MPDVDKRINGRSVKNEVRLKDALANYYKESGSTDEYCRGLLVGVVSGLSACGIKWIVALAWCAAAMPRDGRELTVANVPESWLPQLVLEMKRCLK